MKKVLIDTDVLIDFFFDREPFSESAETILAMCEEGEIDGFITSVICSNCYYLLRKSASHNKVARQLRKLLGIIHVLLTDKETLMQALDSEFNDFEDAIQNFSAIHHGSIQVLITRNTKDYRKSNLAVFTPDEFLAAIQPSEE